MPKLHFHIPYIKFQSPWSLTGGPGNSRRKSEDVTILNFPQAYQKAFKGRSRGRRGRSVWCSWRCSTCGMWLLCSYPSTFTPRRLRHSWPSSSSSPSLSPRYLPKDIYYFNGANSSLKDNVLKWLLRSWTYLLTRPNPAADEVKKRNKENAFVSCSSSSSSPSN